MGRLAKFWSLTRREKKFLCEASILLALSNFCVKAIAFRHIDRFLRIRWKRAIPSCIDKEQEIKLVRRSIARAANLLPLKSLCLSRSIAEFTMLRRRGIQATISAGARFSGDSSLEAHAWVDTDNVAYDNPNFTTVMRIGTAAVERWPEAASEMLRNSDLIR